MGRLLAVLKTFDWMLFALVFLLLAFGIVMLYSLTLNVEKPDTTSFHEQLIFATVGLVLFFLFSILDYRYWRSYGWLAYIGGALLLIAVVFFGREIRGAKSWFVVGSFTFQPVELAKVCLIVFFAKYFSDHRSDLYHIRHLWVSGLGVGLYLLLVMRQPDLGSAMILLGLFLCHAVFVNINRRHLVLLVLVVLVGSVLSWFFLLHGYQKKRIEDVFYPAHDALKLGYNVKQSTVAVGSGKFFGRGLGLGTQSQLHFLPEQKTDFIFAVVAEELGLVGSGLLVLLFVLLFLRLLRIANACRDDFGTYLVFGIFIVLFIQMAMNIGMNIGVMPVVGVPLPLVSLGGSSLISMLLALGIAESVSMRQRREAAHGV